MTPNTDAPRDDAHYASDEDSDDDSASPDYLILDSSIKLKIDPKSIIKTKKIQ